MGSLYFGGSESSLGDDGADPTGVWLTEETNESGGVIAGIHGARPANDGGTMNSGLVFLTLFCRER